MTPPGLFVTGTDTGVGKTRIAVALCHVFAARGLRVAAMKPIASGCARTTLGLRNDDALALHGAMTVGAAYDDVNPYAFEPPIAPHIAAAEAGVEIDFGVLDAARRRLRAHSDVLIVEGAGGWLAPIGPARSFADLAAAWDLEIVLVVGLRLGCLNHALLTSESIGRRGLRLRGWVGNAIDSQFERARENVDSLRERLPAPCLGVIPHTPEFDPLATARALAGCSGPAFAF